MLSKFWDGLKKTRNNITSLWVKLDYDQLQEALILADISFETSDKIIEKLRCEKIKDMDLAKEKLRQIVADILSKPTSTASDSKIKIFIGVNGVGKTTTIAKIAQKYLNNNKKVMLVAGDTFRAAATQQLGVWGERLNIPVIAQAQGADSASVVYDAIHSKQYNDTDYCLIDTAGRMHNKANLMQELEKIIRIANKVAKPDIYLVIDANTGQNAIMQAKGFSNVSDISGIIITKLDSSSKGGIVISIADELEIPVIFVGVGETADDLIEFNADEFAKGVI